jgi:hypothetical protein
MWLKKRALAIAVEGIDFQSGAFFRELTGVFKELADVSADHLPDHPAAQQLPTLINHYTGMNVRVVWGDAGPAVMPALINKNNPLLNCWADWIRQQYLPNTDGDKLIADAKTRPVGRVDRKNGRVSGAFSNVENTMYMPVDEGFRRRLSPAEIASTVLHELGHVFGYFELVSATLSTNQILAGLSKKLDQSGSVKDREAVLVKVKDAAGLKDLDAEALAKSSDKKVIETVVVSNIAREIESELGTSLYDINSFEVLADQFAARHGAGRDIVTALDKLMRDSGHIQYRSTTSYLLMEAIKLALIAAGPITYGLTWAYCFFMCAGDSLEAEEDIYALSKVRYGRVRDQIVEAMKNKKLSEEQIASYTEDLTVIDEVIAGVKDRQQVLGYVRDFLSPIRRRRISQEKLQRELETIAHNDLFVRAASLRQFV